MSEAVPPRGRAVNLGMKAAALSRASLDLLPDPVAVVDRTRTIVSANHRFDVAIGHPEGGVCCELVGCGSGELDGLCVTDWVISHDSSLTVSVSLPGFAGPRDLTAIPVRDGEHVMLRFEAQAIARAAPDVLRLSCLGTLRVGHGPGPDESPEWLQQRSGLLLRYLIAMRRRHVRAEEIAEALWERVGSAGPGTARYLVHQLRRRLEPGLPNNATSRYVRSLKSGGYRLDLENVLVDADEFESQVRAAVALAAGGRSQASEQALLRAVDLYRGEFLADDPYEEWAITERNHLHAMLDTALRMLIEARLAAGDVETAARHAERLAQHEPLDAEVQRLALELLLRCGQRSRAARHYDVFRARLWRTLGVVPPFELGDLIRLED